MSKYRKIEEGRKDLRLSPLKMTEQRRRLLTMTATDQCSAAKMAEDQSGSRSLKTTGREEGQRRLKKDLGGNLGQGLMKGEGHAVGRHLTHARPLPALDGTKGVMAIEGGTDPQSLAEGGSTARKELTDAGITLHTPLTSTLTIDSE